MTLPPLPTARPSIDPVTQGEIEQMRQLYIKRGRDARREGLERKCPFPPGDRWTDAWLDGWDLEDVKQGRAA
jgi:hypothetical protein